MKLPVTLVLDNVRSAHNVGAILRTAEAAGVPKIVAAGLTPYPKLVHDERLPHVIATAERRIAKTALGAEKMLDIQHADQTASALSELKRSGHHIYLLEQAADSTSLFDWRPAFPLALVLGHERQGVDPGLEPLAEEIITIPQFGSKESLNVAVAAGIALYYLLQHQR